MLPKLAPRRHALLITLWADGHSVEGLTHDNGWRTLLNPIWGDSETYSILLEKHRLTSGPAGVTLDPLPTPPVKGNPNGTT